MKKHVYLFELDSVRKTDEEIIAGQKALYNEIVGNGNVVVLTYNQFVDSRGFFSLLADPDYDKNLISLFEKGAIRISQWGDIRTISQYLINAMDEDKEFIYSALPLKYSQKRLVALVKRSLVYSDLSEIHGYCKEEKRTEDELAKLWDLFREVKDGVDSETCLSEKQMGLIVKKLYALLSTVLRLSSLHDIYILPRDEKEYHDAKMHDILAIVLSWEKRTDALWTGAVDILRGLPCYEKKNDNRSVYQRELQKSCTAVRDEGRRTYQYAEAIVNLCYNYACEMSICNISKHYNRLDGDATFEKDFYARLAQDWNDAKNADSRYLIEETNEFDAFDELDQIPNFEEAVRMTEYVNYKKEDAGETVARYEFEMQEQRSRQKRQALSAIGRRVGVSLICVLVACSLEVFSQYIQDMFDAVVNFDTIYWGVIETILFLAVSEAVTTWLAARFPWLLSLSDALGGLGVLCRDIRGILFGRAATYSHDSNEAGSDFQEHYSSGVAIDYVRSGALKKYIRYRKDPANKPLFAKSELYPLADVDDGDVVRELARQEELFHWQFGITYQSKYNQMVVDPIVAENGRYYPYERVVPTAGNGVVIVAKCRGNFLLLRQFRHAIRAEQYSFPRGYAEPNTSPEENVKTEISEELGARVKAEPYLLGKIETDSGLTSSRVSVYLVEIEDYVTKTGYEGIREVVELQEEQLEKKIADQEISDGFTLAAFELYKENRRSL